MSKKDANIEILVVEHKPSYVPENDFLKPIQVGASLATTRLEDVAYYDDSGDNISDKNRSYCELTAIYWAWKNLKADYYGLFHYRRYLSFSDNQDENDLAGIAYPSIRAALPDMDLDEAKMRSVIEAHDVIVPRLDDTKTTTHDDSVYLQYEREHYIQDLDYCMDYIKKHHTNVAPYVDVLHSNKVYFCNMFIMKREVFNDYCSFMFDVLDSFEANTDISNYNPAQHRVTGFLAERLTNIYIHYLLSLEKFKIKELQLIYFENTSPKPQLLPASKVNNVPIVLAANNFYVPYISTLIHSIANHASDTHTYDITVFNGDITPESMQLLKGDFIDRPNIKIRFYDISDRYDEYKGLFTRGHFALETYFRLFIQDIMIEYPKVLYLDGDMIVNADVAELYDTDVNGFLMAAAPDPDTAGLYNGFEPQKKEYMDNVLKIERPYEYFQAGVILFNLDEMRKTLDVSSLLKLAGSYEWELLDQDVLNFVAQGKTKLVDMSWNVMYDWRRIRLTQIVSLAPVWMYQAYVNARRNPRIIHYAGPEKPWHEPDCDFATYYWRVARQSVFYEQILTRMADSRVRNAYKQTSTFRQRKNEIRGRAAGRLRRSADRVAPAGTLRRRPITALSRIVKKIV